MRQYKRGAGILMPISSLPSNYGIGTMGAAAYEFVDFLHDGGQGCWQVLPVCPTSYGDSPYQSFSAFAGNPYFIDLDVLAEEGLLKQSDLSKYDWGTEGNDIDYAAIYRSRFSVLMTACKNSSFEQEEAYAQFCGECSYWLSDYSLFMAIKGKYENREWLLWDEKIRLRKPSALAEYQKKLSEEIRFFKFCQYKFNGQWKKLKAYANQKGIKIIGDIPLYVAMDSADVWVHGSLFELDQRKNPVQVAGVPPDAFSATGQRWGNPLYDWMAMENDGFQWWRERMKENAKLYDVIRIDHFIGIVRYYSIPAGCSTAMEGRWRKGPGKKLTDAIAESIGDADIIAEDLGIVVPAVRHLMIKTGWPGMKVLEFAFDGGEDSEYLPHNYKGTNMLVYGGTHDNETILGFVKKKSPEQMKFMYEYLGVNRKADIPAAMLRLAYSSVADMVIFQMQDILELDNSARMNQPSTLGGNWRWRITKDQITKETAEYLRKLAETFGRVQSNPLA